MSCDRIGKCGRRHISKSRPFSSKLHLRIATPSLPTVGIALSVSSRTYQSIRCAIYLAFVGQPFVTDTCISDPILSFQSLNVQNCSRGALYAALLCHFFHAIPSFSHLSLALVLLPPCHASIIFEWYGQRFERVLSRRGFGHSIGICGKIHQRQRVCRGSCSAGCSEGLVRPTRDHHESGGSTPQAHGGDDFFVLIHSNLQRRLKLAKLPCAIYSILKTFSLVSRTNST